MCARESRRLRFSRAFCIVVIEMRRLREDVCRRVGCRICEKSVDGFI